MEKDKNTIPQKSTAVLVFADGKTFFGFGIGKKGKTIGEICFTTGLTGYQETLTDPSFSQQIITFTFPHIGNIGTTSEDMETTKPACNGLIVRENITNPSNFRNEKHLNKWLEENGITGIAGVDTRAITRYIRTHGAQNVIIHYFDKKSEVNIESLQKEAEKHPSMKGKELAMGVTCEKSSKWDKKRWELGAGYQKQTEKKYKVVAFDYGAKTNILRSLASVGFDVTVVPANTSFEEIKKLSPDGVFLSNGPGDPAATGEYAIEVIKKIIDANIPIFGICLGHQLLARALGCTTTKMHQGHRGSNHPVKNLKTGNVEITSQNHGFVVNKAALPEDVEITHLSLFDDTIEGIRSKTKPAFSVQYHPESSPGPHDSVYLFKEFFDLIDSKVQ